MICQLTERAYKVKPEKGSPEWKTLTWISGEFENDELMEHLSKNHFYRANFKSTSNFGEKEYISAQVILLDYDNGQTTMDDYVSRIKYPPSFYYRSHSSDETGNKFRIGYILDKPIFSPDEFRVFSEAIADNNGGGLTSKDFDHHSFSPYQLWCGSEYEFHRDSSCILSLDELKKTILEDNPDAFYFETRKTHNDNVPVECRVLSTDEQRIKDDFFCLRYDTFIEKYMSVPIVCSRPVKENEAFYFYDKNNYFEIVKKYKINEQGLMSHYRKNSKNQYEPLRFVDGEHRRNKISATISFIHQIEPGIGLGELLAQAIYYINNYIDNTKDSINNHWIWNMVFDEFVNPQKYKSKIRKSYSLKREYFSYSQVHHKTKYKEYKKQYCLSLYDSSISLEDNLTLINSYLQEETNGVISVSQRTLKGYLKEEGLLMTEMDRLKSLYKEGLLTMDLLNSFKDKINRKTYFKYKHKINTNPSTNVDCHSSSQAQNYEIS